MVREETTVQILYSQNKWRQAWEINWIYCVTKNEKSEKEEKWFATFATHTHKKVVRLANQLIFNKIENNVSDKMWTFPNENYSVEFVVDL